MRLVFRIITVVALAASIGCGGVQQPESKATKCRKELDSIFEEKSDDICDPIAVEQFETRLVDWRDICLGYADLKERADLDKKLSDARRCAENKTRWETKRKECAQRVEEIAIAGDCLGEACAVDLKDIKAVIADCSEPEINGPHMETATKLVFKLEERIAKADVLEGLMTLMDECSRIHQMAGEIDAQALLERILAELAKQGDLSEAPEGSEVQRALQDTLVSCRNVFEPALETVTAQSVAELGDEKLKKKPEKWLASLKRLEDLDARLKDIGAEKMFPGSTEPLKQALAALTDIKISLTGSKGEISIAEENRTSDSDLKFLRNSEKKCKKLSKNKDRFEKKVQSYKKSGNEKKVAAYQNNLDKANNELETIKGQLKRLVETTKMPKEELDATLKDLEKAGCSVK